MEKIKRFAFAAALIAIISVAAACGRNDRKGTPSTTAGTTSTAADIPLMTSADGRDTNTGNNTGNGDSEGMLNGDNMWNETHGETGGVLRDMVDDVMGTTADHRESRSSNKSGSANSAE